MHTCYIHVVERKGTPPTASGCVDTRVCTQLMQNERWALEEGRPGFKSQPNPPQLVERGEVNSASELRASPGGMSTRTAPPPDMAETQ